MKRYALASSLLIAMSGVLTHGDARASELTFDITGIYSGLAVDQAYGDNITAATVGGFSYGTAQGLTPNVTVDYGPLSPYLWTTSFGDLTNVLLSSVPDPNLLVLTLTAASGFDVRLHSFDLAGWTPGFGSDPTINSVTVLDGNNNVLYSATNPTISISSHTSFAFVTPLTAPVIKVQIDALNLDSDDIGIDNLTFSQVETDMDGDGIVNSLDNCTLVANPNQRDTNGDGYGNLCDPDLNNDGVVNINDYNRLKARLGIVPITDVDADLDGNGAVNINDLNRLKSFLGKPPGPSGLHPNCPPTCP